MALVFVAGYICVSDPFFRVMMSLARQSELLASRYFGEVSPDKVFADAWHGMQRALPFRAELSEFEESEEIPASPQDWGLTLAPLDSSIQVVDIATNSPFRGLLNPEDRITGVDALREEAFVDLIEYLNNSAHGETKILFRRSGHTDSITVLLDSIPTMTTSEPRVDSIWSIRYVELQLSASNDLLSMVKDQKLEQFSAIIFDLRKSHSEDYDLAAKLAEEIIKIADSKPVVLLIDRRTRGAAEELVRKASSDSRIATIGAPTRGISTEIEQIDLRAGQKLYVSVNDKNTERESMLTELTSDTVKEAISPRSVVPTIRCEDRLMSPMVFELIHGDHILSFVTASHYTRVPDVDEEEQLYQDFKRFLANRRFRYDPLGKVLSDMGVYAMDPDMQAAYRQLRESHREMGDSNLDEYRDEVVSTLLKTIHRVKVAGPRPIELTMRTDDLCLKEAVEYLKGRTR